MAEFTGTDRFEIQRWLGAGGMGVVYEARDRGRGTAVALKTLRNVEPHSLYQLKHEFRALQDLEHPNLVSLGELIEESGQWFFTMELVQGVDFLRHVRPGCEREALGDAPTARGDLGTAAVEGVAPAARYDEARLRDALGQLAAGLIALHAAGKVHRDIKPSNVLVTADGRVVLLDFGLVIEATDHDSDRQIVVGTAAYMAPEQAASKPVGPEADWYGVGAMLYEALTGRVPFAGRPLEICMDKQTREPPSPRSLVPDIAPDLDALCVELLRFDPLARPTGEQILARLGTRERGAAPSAAPTLPSGTAVFVGRGGERAIIDEAFAARTSGPVTVYVHGESGVGKSALIRAATAAIEARHADAVVLTGRCYERESVPYKAFDGVIDALSRYLSRLPGAAVAELLPPNAALLPRVFPVLGRVEEIAQAPRPLHDIKDPQELRAQVFAALRGLLQRLATRHPLVIIIDDLQWADAESSLLLSDVLRPPDAPPVLLLISSRVAEHPAAAALRGDVRRLALEPLEPDQARTLARLLLGRAGVKASASQIAVEARGHPLYIDELVRQLALAPGDLAQPLRLDDAIWARVAQLDRPAARLLELVAVAGAPISQETIGHAARMDPNELVRQVSVLRVAHLVRGRGGRGTHTIEPYHDRVRESLLAHLGDRERIEAHRRLAIALEGEGAHAARPELLLRHLEAAGELHKAAHHAEAAAERAAAALAFDRAASLYQTALRLGDQPDERRRALWTALGDALTNAGRGAEAADAYLQALEGAHPSERLELQRRAAEELLISGHLERGQDTLARLLGDIGVALPRTPRRALASLLVQRARLRLGGLRWRERHPSQLSPEDLTRVDVYKAVAHGMSLVDPIRAADFQSRGLSLALRTGERRRVARGLFQEACFVASQGIGSNAAAAALRDRGAAIAAPTGDDYLLGWSIGTSGIVDYFGGRFERAAPQLTESEVIFRERTTGTAWELGTIRLYRMWNLLHLGGYAAINATLDAYLRDARRRGDLFAATTLQRSCSAAWLARGEPERAADELSRAAWTPPDVGFHLQHWFELKARAEIALYTGGAAAEIARGAAAFRGLGRSMLTHVQFIRAEARAVRARLALATGDPAALPGVARLARALARERVAYAAVWADLLRAAVAIRRGRPGVAVTCLRRAVAAADTAGMGHSAAAARARLADLVEPDQAATLRADAAAWAAREHVAWTPSFLAVIAPR